MTNFNHKGSISESAYNPKYNGIDVQVQDDLTDLSKFAIVAHGHKVED